MVGNNFLKGTSTFTSLTDDEIQKVSGYLQRQAYFRGEKIYGEDEPGGKLYIICHGEVGLSRVLREGEHHTLITLGKGQSFGCISLLDGRPHSATAKALTDAEVFILSRGDFNRICQDNPVCAIKLMRVLASSLCEYLRRMNAKFSDMVNYVSLD